MLKFNRRNFAFYTPADYNPNFVKNIQAQSQIRNADKDFRFAVVGSGPAGFYMSKMLLMSVPKCRVDIFDQNPHPYGLIRTGVCPDHMGMKKIERDFNQVFEHNPGRCEFIGNVRLGRDIYLKDLQQNYSATILAIGTSTDKEVGLKGEYEHIIPARRVFNWYNSSLEDDIDLSHEFNLTNTRDIAIIGNGNIFCDMTRVLLRNPKDFSNTDMH